MHKTEYVETGADSQPELQLDDQTKLALGPNAGLRLDDFVIGQSDGVTSIGVNFVKGTFRFLSGKKDSKAYRIETPSATIGVRGTVFDVYVDGKGDTLVLLHEGEVDVCTKSRNCQRHNSAGRIVHATVAGVVTAPIKFTAKLIPGLSVERAFPFVGRTLSIDPIRRLRATDLVDPVLTRRPEIWGEARMPFSVRSAAPCRSRQRARRGLSPPGHRPATPGQTMPCIIDAPRTTKRDAPPARPVCCCTDTNCSAPGHAACMRSSASSYTVMFLPNEIAAAMTPQTRCIERHGSRVLLNSSITAW